MDLRTQRGFSLVEVLVTVVVLSIGLLGLAGLQMTGLRYNQSAHFRSQASLLAYDLIDRMRANPDAVASGDYDAIDSDAPPDDPACISSGCTAAELAAHDAREWSRNFSGATPLIPAAQGTVTRNGDIFTVRVGWAEQSQNESGAWESVDRSVTIEVRVL